MQADHLALMIRDSVAAHAALPAVLSKVDGRWRSMSYADLGARIDAVAQGLVAQGISAGDAVGIYSPNRPEWTVADLAILSVGAVSVPLYATSTAEQVRYVIDDARLRLLFVGGPQQQAVVEEIPADARSAVSVVSFDAGDPAAASTPSLADLERAGAASEHADEVARRLSAVSTDDLATVIYTSGTTGEPKGAMLLHANLFHQFRALDDRFHVGPGDRSLCFLPLSHAYERGWTYYVLRAGAENAYLDDPKRVVECMGEVRPSLMVSVPRLFEKIQSAVVDRLEHASAARRRMFSWALRVGSDYQERRSAGGRIGPVLAVQHNLADRLVLSKIREVVGGPKNVFSAGGAPLSPTIERFFLSAGVLVCQGYGLTETSPMVSCNAPGAFRFGTVGRPILGCEVRIAEDGEILVRGGNVMAGYLNKPDETAEAIVDGWFHTGDLGVLDDDGYLRVTGRIKDIIITSQGKNVAPQRIETLIGADHYVEQIVVIGDQRTYLTALIEPAFPALEEYARTQGVAFESTADLVTRPEIVEFYRRRIDSLSEGLAGYERIKRFTLMPRSFTQDGGELTPTLKIKRRVVEETCRSLIDAMYAEA